jgi:sialate O-acetylesterase
MLQNIKMKNIIYLILLISVTSFCQVKLPKLISNGMILQREANVKIWGRASGGEKISIRFVDSTYFTAANNNGEWEVILPKLKAGGPYNMQINASNSITINDILIGDVWVCSGQSNMGFVMQDAASIYGDEIANSTNKYIRQFTVPNKYDFHVEHKDLAQGSWQSANPKTILRFSAVAYFFAKKLYEKYKIPIGLINSSLGGSRTESWMSQDALKQFPNLYEESQKYKDSSLIVQTEKQDRERSIAWNKMANDNDESRKDPQGPWYNQELNTSGWNEMKVPGKWADTKLGYINGVVWFRRDFDVPASLAGKQCELKLGRIVDADSVFINGTFIARGFSMYMQRNYDIPSNVLKEGKNNIVVRIVNTAGKGGFVGGKPYEIIAGNDKIDLKGNWKFKLGYKMDPLPEQTFIMWKAAGLYNTMISPLLNYAIKGVIWYQGESNTSRSIEQRELFPALIKNWRDKWKLGEFPFLFVQLPNFVERTDELPESDWALFRESQLRTLSVPNTGMAVTIDVGEWNDIHPLDKKDVGIRLALAAQKLAYGDNKVVYSGPIYESVKIVGNKIILSFNHRGSGLVSKGNRILKCFTIAGADKKFIQADAKIKGDKVIVWNDKISKPVAVRYAWADNPEGANLYNKEGLPASPFRTDDF